MNRRGPGGPQSSPYLMMMLTCSIGVLDIDLNCEDNVATCSLINIDGGAFPSLQSMHVRLFREKNMYCSLC